MAVTKTVPIEDILAVVGHGVAAVGENRVQEAREKVAQLPESVERHGIGRLQTNKARDAVRLFHLVHGLDRPELAVALDRAAAPTGQPCRVLVQVNVAGSEGQGGLLPQDLNGFIEFCAKLPYLRMDGMMAIGPHAVPAGVVRESFRTARELFRQAAGHPNAGPAFTILSLGMSGDFEDAVEEGSTLVRIGTAIFGERRHE